MQTKPPPEASTVVACLQFEPLIGELDHNRKTGSKMIEQAADKGAVLVILPELCDSGYVFETRAEAFELSSEVESSPTIEGWCSIAKRRGIYIVGGFCERSGEALYNSAAIIGPDGLIGIYRKLHLWGAEALYFERGNLGVPVFTTRIGRISALICYDGWFPEA